MKPSSLSSDSCLQAAPTRARRKAPLASLGLACSLTLAIAASAAAAAPTDAVEAASTPLPEQPWALHGQITNVTQGHPNFNAPYSGTNSLVANGRTEETTDLTLYAGLRLWHGAQLWANPEIDQGFGLSNTVGMAGFPSGEAYKIGADAPYLRLPRLFLRQVIALGAETVRAEGSANQLGGMQAADNLTLTVGKFSATDIFDTNTYAHDPRGDFLNWSVIDAGAFDYAADAWGFTYGAAAEWTQASRTLRGGVFQLSKVPNGKVTGVDFSQFMLVTEVEQRYRLSDRAGKLKLLAFANRGRMGRYQDAIGQAQASGDAPDTALVRRRAWRPGVSLNLEQELASDLGAFLRASVNRGDYEAYEFTEINRSLSGGLALQGQRWGRPDDTVGMAAVVNGLSADARRYFAAGGNGILIGEGALRYGAERIFETYYALRLRRGVTLAVDYQYAGLPAYNRDRGPVSFFGLRAHAEF